MCKKLLNLILWGKHMLLLALICCTQAAFSQQPATITGVVVDSIDTTPLQGVSVFVQGSNKGTTTDAAGAYSISVPPHSVLIFKYIGYLDKQIFVDNQRVVNASLSSSNQGLDEVVVVGYGTQKKTSVTAAVSTLKGENFSSTPVTNISNSLGGRVSGVIVKQTSGEPGKDGSNIYIRGIASTGNNQPLTVVDGIPRDFKQLDPNSIETITILKDAAAVAPYGVAGANGVVLVTTKRGKSGLPTLTYNSYVGFQNPTVLPDYVDAIQFATMKNTIAREGGLPVPYPDYALQKFKDGSDPEAYPNVDVFKEIITPNAILTSHNIELSGGAERIKYYASLGYQYQAGMWSTTNQNRYNLSINLDAQVTNTTKVALNVSGRNQKDSYPAVETSRIFELVSYSFPVLPLTYSNGQPATYVMGSIFGSGYQDIKTTALYSELSIEQQLPFISGLSLKGTIAYDPQITFNKTWRTPVHLWSIDTTKRPYEYRDGIFEQTQPSLNEGYVQSYGLTYQASLNYNKIFGKSNVGALAVFEARGSESSTMGASRRNYNLTIDELSLGSSSLEDASNSGLSSAARQIGLVYRLTYDYASKYLFEASGRYDGSYYFSPANRFGFFPAFSAGWRISEENFLKDNAPWLENLKIRGSYGEAGALAGSAFQYLSTYNVFGPAYMFGNSGRQGIRERLESNPDITWERAKKSNIGLEASFWKGLLSIEADYFNEKRSNMLVSPQVLVPVEYGIGLGQVNAGVMKNQGVDFSIGSVYNISTDLQVSLNGNLTYAKNTLLEVFETDATYNNPNRRKTGKPLGTQFGFRSLGLFQISDFEANGDLKPGIATQPWGKLQPGDIRYEDKNGDGKINDDDITSIGDPGTPTIVYGISPSIRYKRFAVDLLFQGAAKTDFYFYREGAWPFHAGRGAFVEHLDYWTPDNPNASNPRLTGGPTLNSQQTSSFWMQDASYLRLKSATFAYTIPSLVSKKIGIQNARIYVSGQNILTWTKLKNYDPENSNFRGHTYPQQKVISVGINTTF